MKPEIGSIGRYGDSQAVCIAISAEIDLTFWNVPNSTPYIDFYFFDELEVLEYVWEN